MPINLLPPQERARIARRGVHSMAAILGVIGIASLISFSLILFIVNISIGRDLTIQEVLVAEKEKEIAQYARFEEEMREINTTVNVVSDFFESRREMTPLIERISSHMPPAMQVTQMSIGVPETKEAYSRQIFISGMAPLRDHLLAFRDALESDAFFQEVIIPHESLFDARDVRFRITVRIEP